MQELRRNEIKSQMANVRRLGVVLGLNGLKTASAVNAKASDVDAQVLANPIGDVKLALSDFAQNVMVGKEGSEREWRAVDVDIRTKKAPVMVKILQDTLSVVTENNNLDSAAAANGAGDKTHENYLQSAQNAISSALALTEKKVAISSNFWKNSYQKNFATLKKSFSKAVSMIQQVEEFRQGLREDEEERLSQMEDTLADAESAMSDISETEKDIQDQCSSYLEGMRGRTKARIGVIREEIDVIEGNDASSTEDQLTKEVSFLAKK